MKKTATGKPTQRCTLKLPKVKVGEYITREQIRQAIMEDLDVKSVSFSEFCTYIVRRLPSCLESLSIMELVVPEKGLKKVDEKGWVVLPADLKSSTWEV